MRRPIATSLVAAVLMAGWCASAAAVTVGTIVRVQGEVAIVQAGTITPAFVGQAVDSAANIRSGADGKVLVELVDGSTVTLAADTAVSMAELVPASPDGFLSGIIDLVSGAVRVLAAPSPETRRLEVRTGMGVAAVRSTRFFVEASPAGMAVFVWAGRVAVSPASAAMTVELTEGEGIDIKPSPGDSAVLIMPDAPTKWSAPRIASIDERTNMQ
jgi:ferric-dicitrate binding protein FerR (iron transport regulator)